MSAGAINTGAISVFAKGDEERMLKVLSDTWASLDTSNLYRDWKPAGMVSGITSHTGIFDTYPFGQTLYKFFGEYGPVKRKYVVSATDVATGAYIQYNETSADPVQDIISSASIPFVFPMITHEGPVYTVDGGVIWNTNLAAAVQRCKCRRRGSE